MKSQFFRKHHVMLWASLGAIAYILLFMAPVCKGQIYFSGYDDARSLAPGQIEVSAEYTSMMYEKYSWLNHSGLSAKMGISSQFDLSLGYGRYFGYGDGFNAFYIAPKFTDNNGVIAFKVPLGLCFEKRKSYFEGEPSGWAKLYYVSPRILITVPGKKAELNVTPMIDIVFNDSEPATQFGISLGGGFSSNLDVWSFRPEVTLYIPVSRATWPSWQAGVAFTYRIPRSKESKGSAQF